MDHLTFAQLLGNYGEFFGGIVVVVSVVYLALQLRHANNIARFNSSHQLQVRFNETNDHLLADESLRELLAKDGLLTADDEERLYVFANFVGNIWISVQEARNHHQIEENLFQGMCNDVDVALQRWPNLRAPVQLWLSRYPQVQDFEIFDAVLRPK